MANGLYDSGRSKFLDGSIAWSTDTIKVSLVRSSTYTPNLATHTSLADVTAGGAVVATVTLGSKTSTAGVADAADPVFTAVASGAAIQYLVYYKDTGTPSTSWLIACTDTATGLPVTPGGGDITVTLDNGTNKIFKL